MKKYLVCHSELFMMTVEYDELGNEFVIEHEGVSVLTVGKKYEIISENNNYTIINDEGERHSFTKEKNIYDEYYEYWFTLEERGGSSL